MKTIIAGSRTITDVELVEFIIEEYAKKHEITELVCGKAIGVDTIAENWAKRHNIKVEPFEPKYDVYGPKLAPLMRNTEMAEYGEALLAIHNGTKGTRDMIKKAMKKKLHITSLDLRDNVVESL